ncbi:MAG: HEAT repeat domain-containing protein [Anaerolineae bacterium]|jgi:HEAT repeat protein
MHDRLQAFLDAVAAGDDVQTEESAIALSEMEDEAIPALRDALADLDPGRRWWAVRALAAVGTDAAIRLLITALEDVDADVRACAVVALAKLKPEEAIEPLVARLSDRSAYVGRLTADGLAQFGQPAVNALIGALEDGDTAARAGAARALTAIQPEEAIPALYRALDDPSALVSYYADEALERMGVGIVLFRP